MKRILALSDVSKLRWGDCPVCGAKDGERCVRVPSDTDASFYSPMIRLGDGRVYFGLSHAQRMAAAPRFVELVPVMVMPLDAVASPSFEDFTRGNEARTDKAGE
jgi:hypothetical protein